MKTNFKAKSNINNFKRLVFLTIILIIGITFFLIKNFIRNISENIINISESEITRVTYSFITNRINHDLITKEDLNNILVITKNKNDEILYVDFNLDIAYKVLDNVSEVMTSSFRDLEQGNINISYYDDFSHKTNSLILSIPFGSTLNNMFLYNMGPKIPVKVNFNSTILTNLETKITNYGLNNALVEVFVYIECNNEIMAPFKLKNMNFKYKSIIASMMIEGSVPDFYNGSINKTI